MSRIKQQTSFKLNRPAAELFPLFSAEGEKLWAPGWDYENVMGSKELHEDYVFLTAPHPEPQDHGHDPHPASHHSPHHLHQASLHQMNNQHQASYHKAPKTIWLVKRHEPENFFVQFYMVKPDEKVGIVTVHCKPITEESTEVEVAYEYIGLSKKGNDFVAQYTVDVHEAFIADWPKLLTAYFETRAK